MALQDVSFDPYKDTRSKKEKNTDFGGAALLVTSVAGFLIARKKLAITRGISKDILGAGLGSDPKYNRFLSLSGNKNISPKATSLRENVTSTAQKVQEAIANPSAYTEKAQERIKSLKSYQLAHNLLVPLPSDEEQYNISVQFLSKHLKHPTTMFPSYETFGLKESSLFDKIVHGPKIVPFAPGTTLGMVGRVGAPKVVGKHGALLIGNKLHFLLDPRKAERMGTFYDPNAVIDNVRVGIVKSWGANVERERRGLIKTFNPRNTEEYVRRTVLGTKPIIDAERREFVKREYINRFFPGVGTSKGQTMGELRQVIKDQMSLRDADVTEWNKPRYRNPVSGNMEPIPTLEEFMGHKVSQYELTKNSSLTFRRKMLQDAAISRRIISQNASKGIAEQAGFAAFRMGRKMGVGEEFAPYGMGFPQKVERWVKDGAQWNYKHPTSGEIIPATPRRYNVTGKTLGSNWMGSEGPWFITTPEDSLKRRLNVLSSGTLHRVWQTASGIGISSRPNIITEGLRKTVGAKEGSWADTFIRNMGKTGKVIGLGLGAYYGYKAVDALVRSTLGWGPTDAAADAYVHYREWQQNLLDNLHIIGFSQVAENAFPGSVSSPLSHAVRLLAPAILAKTLGRKFGPKGFRAGLAVGLAFALITWGDITQTPEQLHRIYTGEDDIPVRKGRYWIMGETPFQGGQISYWRPHWYALKQSEYQYQGQLWSSKKEYWAEGTPISPLVAPLLGYKYDPYYWEKKHYQDRPYLLSGELFEPTMPFAALGNATIGNLIKPPVIMHAESLGAPQTNSSEQERGIPANIGPELGFPELPSNALTGGDSPYSARYQLGLAAYSQSEQMGLLGYGINVLNKKVTGETDFMTDNTVIQTSRRATGYERGYWQKEIGDPGAGLEEGLTEYFRRFLPHRRSNVDEYNPVPNQMPSWLPGDDYFINFRQGDPYVKIPYGEARLPGAGYESLHRLHSGEAGVYDPIDRFLILANVAPYSDEYKQYRRMAQKMSGGDDYWSRKVTKAIDERDELSQEYQFLSLQTDGVPDILKRPSSLYRHALAGLEEIPNPLEINPMAIAVKGWPTHVNKWISNKTPESTYRDYLLYGGVYEPWDQPVESFVTPVVDKTRRIFDPDFVPASVQRQRDVEEYFDKLKYIKYTNLAAIARFQGDSALASKLSHVARSTMAYGNYNPATAMMSIPSEERPFYNEFSKAEGDRREHILKLVPSYMRPYYMEAWNKADGKETYNIDYHTAESLTAYFKDHYLPEANWEGWHPDINLNQIKLRVVKNDAFDIHKFNLWESEERELNRQPYTPLIENINAPSNSMTMLQNTMIANMEKLGLTNNRVYITRTPASDNSHTISINIDRDNSQDDDNAMNANLASIQNG